MYKQYKKIITALSVVMAIVLVLESTIFASADVISDLRKSIEEKQAAIAAAESEKKNLKSGLTGVEKIINGLQANKANLTAYVSELDSNVMAVQVNIETLENLIVAKEAEIEESRVELENAQETERNQYEAMKERIRFMYEKGDGFYLDMILSASSFADALNKYDYIQQLSAYDRQTLTQYQEMVEYVSLCKQELEAEEALLDEAKLLAEEEKSELETLIAQKQSEIKAYEADISNKEKLVKEYEEEIAAQNAVIEELEAAVAADRANLLQARVYDGGVFCWPAPEFTRISDDYGWRLHPILNVQQFHSGVDMASPGGSSILAAYDGEVISASYNASMGNYIMIDHGDSLYTIYMHASKLLVSAGDEVTRGQKIATVGSTGRSTGNHLHFGVRLNGSYVSPWTYITEP